MGQKKSSGAVIRQIVLIVLLLVVAGAAVYDFKVARPAAVKAEAIIQKAATDDRVGVITNVDIQKLIGKKPSKTEGGPGKNSYLEKYTWTSGLLFKSYYIWCVYSPNEPHIFNVHYLNSDVDREFRPDYKSPASSTPRPTTGPANVGSAGGSPPPTSTVPATGSQLQKTGP
jgi:hypothetical protein